MRASGEALVAAPREGGVEALAVPRGGTRLEGRRIEREERRRPVQACIAEQVVEVIALEERDHAPHFTKRTGHRRKQHDEWQCGLASAPSGDASARGSCIDTGGVAHYGCVLQHFLCTNEKKKKRFWKAKSYPTIS